MKDYLGETSTTYAAYGQIKENKFSLNTTFTIVI